MIKIPLLHRVALGIVAFSTLAGVAVAQTPNYSTPTPNADGYLKDARNVIVRNSFGECWRTGYWTPAMAVPECDASLVKVAAPAAAPAPAPAPAAAPAPTTAKVTLSDKVLFDFDKATLRPEGKASLDTEVIAKLKQVSKLEVILVSGHTDRLGSVAYNQKLSERRANAVKEYLHSQGVAKDRIETIGMGKTQPVVACDNVKPRKKLIDCLQPNRRVEVDIIGEMPAK